MAVTALAYAAPMVGGYALVVTAAARRTLAAALQIQMEKPQREAIAALVPAALSDGAGSRLRVAAQDALRRVASEIATPPLAPKAELGRRWRLALVVTGWLLLIAAGQSWAQVLAGVWLAILFPLFARWQSVQHQTGFDHRACALGQFFDGAVVELREHAGLTELRRALEGMELPDADRYAAVAAACSGAGLSGLRDTYLALAQGQMPPDVNIITFAPESAESRQDATAPPEEGEPPRSSSAVLSAQIS